MIRILLALILFLIFPLLSSHALAVDCQPRLIVALAPDGSYVVVEPKELRVVDVGNLWWLGIAGPVWRKSGRGINLAIKGSTYHRAGLVVDGMVDPITRTLTSEDSVLIIVDQLGFLDVPKSIKRFELDETSSARLLSNESETTLLLFGSNQGMREIRVYDQDLDLPAVYKVDSPGISARSFACRRQEELMIGASRELVTIRGENSTVRATAEIVGGESGFSLTGISQGCVTVLVKAKSESRMTYRVVDFSRDKVMSEFETNRMSTFLLFEGGSLLVQQDLDAELVDGGPGVRTTPTNRFRIIDTNSGEVLKDQRTGAIGKMSMTACSADGERAVIVSANQIQLLDLMNLEITEQVKVPFDRFFVF